jgi:hypothetical protein
MKVRISGIKGAQYETMMAGFGKLLEEASGPFRLEVVESKGENNKPVVVKYLRSRTWGEYFYEKLWARVQDIVDAENAASAAIAHVFDPMINQARALKVAHEVGSRKETTGEPAMIDHGAGTSNESNSVNDDRDNINPALADELASNVQGDAHVLKQYLENLQAHVFERKHISSGNAGKPAPASDSKTIKSVNGLFQVPPGVSVCAASPLQFIANVVIVSSATDKSTATVKENATLEQALRKFGKAWTELKNQEHPGLPYRLEDGKPEPDITIVMDNLAPRNGLHHVQHLWCIADDEKSRGKGNLLDNEKLSRSQWKETYLTLWRLAGAKGSVVQELYPNRWDDNPAVSGRRPAYRDENIWGAAEAGLEISSRTPKGSQPVSIMFTVADEKARTDLANAIGALANGEAKELSALPDEGVTYEKALQTAWQTLDWEDVEEVLKLEKRSKRQHGIAAYQSSSLRRRK